MKLVLNTVLLAGLLTLNLKAEEKKAVVNPTARPAAALTNSEAKPDKDKISYAIGMYFGNTIKRQSVDVNLDTVTAGMKDVISGGTTRFDEQEMQRTLQAMSREAMAKREAEAKVVGEKNKTEGKAFLAENAKKPGVKTTASGLQYKVITEGKGETPKASDTVTTHYRGRLINGTEFDSSYKRGQPAEFPVGGVIKGWTEALQLMKVGSKWELYIPAELAYGERGSPPTIGPNATLIFEIELLGIKAPPKAAATDSNQAVSGEIIEVPSAEQLKNGAKIKVHHPGETNLTVQTNTAIPKK